MKAGNSLTGFMQRWSQTGSEAERQSQRSVSACESENIIGHVSEASLQQRVDRSSIGRDISRAFSTKSARNLQSRLPNTPEVRKQLAAGGHSLTFLHVALGIVMRLEEELGTRNGEIPFLRDCLKAGPEQTQISLAISDKKEGLAESTRWSLYTTYAPSLVGGIGESESESIGDNGNAYYSSSQDHSGALPDEPTLEPAKPTPSFASNAAPADGLASPKWPVRLRKDYMLRGWKPLDQIEQVNSPAGNLYQHGPPWMGSTVPRWPTSDVLHSRELEDALKNISNWRFDVFHVAKLTDGRPLRFIGWEVLRFRNAFVDFHLDAKKACRFLDRVESMYATEATTPYHNSIHAADVVQTQHAFLSDMKAELLLDPMDCLVTTIGSAIHDVGHDGKNNAFHISIQDELALTYNDRSVLENYHVSSVFKMLARDPEANFLDSLGKMQFSIVRKEVINAVLATDMSHHFERLGAFNTLIAEYEGDHDGLRADDTAMECLRAMLLHAGDLSNPAKHLGVAQQWSYRCLKEFFAQGDTEKLLGLPVSPLCDRETTSVPDSQLGFINFIVAPSFQALSSLLDRVREVCLIEVGKNKQAWQAEQQPVVQSRRSDAGDEEFDMDVSSESLQRRLPSTRLMIPSARGVPEVSEVKIWEAARSLSISQEYPAVEIV